MFTTSTHVDTIFALTEDNGNRFSVRKSDIAHLIEEGDESTMIVTHNDREFTVESSFDEMWKIIYGENK